MTKEFLSKLNNELFRSNSVVRFNVLESKSNLALGNAKIESNMIKL